MSIDFPPLRDDAFSVALLPLLEENARLRKLAVKLSNLLGDLPEDANRNR